MLFSQLSMLCSTLVLLVFSLFSVVDGHLSKAIGMQYIMPYGTLHSCDGLPPADYSYAQTGYVCCNDDNSCHQYGALFSFMFWPQQVTCDNKIHCIPEGFWTSGPFVYSCNYTNVPDTHNDCPSSNTCPAGSRLSQGNCVRCKKSQWSSVNSSKCNDCPLRKHVVNGPGTSQNDCKVLRRNDMKQFYDDSALFERVLDKVSHSARYHTYNDGQRTDLKDAIVTWMVEVMYQETKIENIAQASKNGKTGPGRGFFQYEVASGGGSGANKVAIQRAITWVKNNEANKTEFDWLTKLQHWNAKTHKTNTVDLDFRDLTKEQQQIIFVLDKYADKAPSYNELRENLVKDSWESVSYANWKRGHWKGTGTPPKWRGQDVWKKWVP